MYHCVFVHQKITFFTTFQFAKHYFTFSNISKLIPVLALCLGDRAKFDYDNASFYAKTALKQSKNHLQLMLT